jgi:hypothetical protein
LLSKQFDNLMIGRRLALLAWQAGKVRDCIDGHITEPVRVTDLCAARSFI